MRFAVAALLSTVALVLAPAAATADPSAAAEEPPPYTEAPFPTEVRDAAYDTLHQRIFVAAHDVISVVRLDGSVQRTVTAFDDPRSLTLSPDGKTLYVLEQYRERVGTLDTTTFAVKFFPIPNVCPYEATFTGGRLWFAFIRCYGEGVGLGSLDPATGQFTDGHAKVGLALDIRALPESPGRLVFIRGYAPYGPMLFDVTSGTPVELDSIPDVNCCGTAIPLPATDELAVVLWDSSPLAIYPAGDLSAEPVRVAEHADPVTVEISPDRRYLAVLEWHGRSATVAVRDLLAGTPGELLRVYQLPEDFSPSYRLLFTGDGRIVVSGYNYDTSDASMFVLNNATVYDTRIKATVPTVAKHGASFEVTGGLDRGPGAGTVLSVTRTDRAGTHLSTITTAADGTFAFPFDGTGLAGRVTFTVSYAGDAAHEPSTWTGSTQLRTLPWDFNGDGYTDAVVGTPGEDDGGTTDTGQFHVLYGTATGVTASGSRAMDQNTPGVDGANEPGDMLGQATASGDFNGDGYADLAVGAPGEDDGDWTDAGMVEVLYGSAAGLTTTASTSLWQEWYFHGAYGRALASGDFNGDGLDDLAVGAPQAGIGGAVFAYLSTPTGFRLDRVMWQGGQGFPTTTDDAGERFGWSLATGDIDADGYADLAIGIPGDNEDKGWSTGAVVIVHADQWGLWTDRVKRVSKDTPGVPGAPGKYEPRTGDGADEFGLKVAMGDFNGDGLADLAASAPGTRLGDQADAGSVTVLYSNGTELSADGSIQITQDTDGIIGLPYDNDFFGDNLAAGDSNGDGVSDLAIFSYGDEYVTVTPGAPGGLALTSTTAWTQDSPGIPGSHESGDKWGASMRFLGGARPALLVGAPGEDSRQGAFTVVWVGPNGLTGDGAQYFGEGTPGVPGEPENGDRFGTF
ncbi:hypothetical protein Afil01_19150 [Actinorhabdospora filicis]|uniref:FG-GAP repeat protein n=1 Tax=Actinorhabdospora filicis TaxID=1785913 RepID=A0A9W6W8L8_9ACTN|nr:hypothetical protein Afil01_19150 [Actinorhabdospora filicis]